MKVIEIETIRVSYGAVAYLHRKLGTFGVGLKNPLKLANLIL